jgi:hypothetical protein
VAAAGSVNPPLLRVARVSLFQALEIPLLEVGLGVAAQIPVIAGKAGLLRVFVEPSAEFQEQDVTAVLALSPALPRRSRKRIFRGSTAQDLASTFNFPLNGDEIGTDASVSLRLETTAGEPLGIFPSKGTASLGAQVMQPLRLHVVPVVVDGHTPDLGARVLDRFRQRLLDLYPISAVELDVGAPLALGFSVTPAGAGWSRALSALEARRARDEPEPRTYYYGVLTPAASYAEYCTLDCTLGVATIAELEEVEYRAAIGVGFFDSASDPTPTDTLAHELGHALGREHAPCGTSDAGQFPYADGSLGVWGFSARTSLLFDPRRYRDVMGYCAPVWVSDFSYVALFDRLSAVAAEPLALAATSNARATYASILVAPDRVLAWGSTIFRSPPQGQEVLVELLGDRGLVIGRSAGRHHALSHDLGGAVLVPESQLSNPQILGLRLPELSDHVLGLAEAPSLGER